MAEIGYSSAGTPGSVLGIEGYYVAIPITMTEDGTANFIGAYLAESTTDNAHTFTAAIYNSGGTTKLDESADVSNVTTVAGWNAGFTGLSYSLSNGVTYWLVIACNFAGGVGRVYYDIGSSGDDYVGNTQTNFPPTALDSDISAAMASDNKQLGIYLSYTPGAGGVIIPQAMHHYRQMQDA